MIELYFFYLGISWMIMIFGAIALDYQYQNSKNIQKIRKKYLNFWFIALFLVPIFYIGWKFWEII